MTTEAKLETVTINKEALDNLKNAAERLRQISWAAISTTYRIYADATAASMSKFHYELEQSQTHLDPEAAKILDDNLENLY